MQLFGILNYTNDSFYDGGQYNTLDIAMHTAQQLLDDGASFIDVGAEATNPFVQAISSEEEINRLEPVLPLLLEQFPDLISLDTYHPATLEWALKFGNPILNDVSGLYDLGIIKLAAEHSLTCIVGHLPPEAKGMPVNSHKYKMDDFNLVVEQMNTVAKNLELQGIQKDRIILDPSIGFGKTMRLNWWLVREFAKAINYPVMIGASHKRFLGFDETGIELPGGKELRHTALQNQKAAHLAQQSGTQYLRVHEPKWYL